MWPREVQGAKRDSTTRWSRPSLRTRSVRSAKPMSRSGPRVKNPRVPSEISVRSGTSVLVTLALELRQHLRVGAVVLGGEDREHQLCGAPALVREGKSERGQNRNQQQHER